MVKCWVWVLAICSTLQLAAQPAGWRHLSTARSELPIPSEAKIAEGLVAGDFDGDGTNDFIVAYADAAPALVLFRNRGGTNWQGIPIELDFLPLARGGTVFDIDRDQDLDVVFGSATGPEIWWWENPSPRFDPNRSWTRHVIKTKGSIGNGSTLFADLTGLGRPQLLFWGGSSNSVFLATAPEPGAPPGDWNLTPIFSPAAGVMGPGAPNLSSPDINIDGIADLLVGNYWLRRTNGLQFEATRIGTNPGRSAVGRFRESSYPQIVVGPEKIAGRLFWYECKSQPNMPGSWAGRQLLSEDVGPLATLAVTDFDRDGNGDILAAEAAHSVTGEPSSAPRAWILFSDGNGDFRPVPFEAGVEMYDAQVVDLDNDGDPDIVSVPHHSDAPRLDIWLNQIPRRGPKTYPR